MQASLRSGFAAALCAAVLMLVPRAAAAGQSQRYGNYVVYYSALSTDLLTPEIARNYGFVRSSHKGLLNIAVMRASGTHEQAVTAKVSGSAINLTGQRVPVDFRKVKDGDAVYYLGTFPVSGTDTMRFELTVTPQGDVAHKLVFSQDYVTD